VFPTDPSVKMKILFLYSFGESSIPRVDAKISGDIISVPPKLASKFFASSIANSFV
jgi:hypothetical protein